MINFDHFQQRDPQSWVQNQLNLFHIHVAIDGFNVLSIFSNIENQYDYRSQNPRVIVLDSLSGCLLSNVLKSGSFSDSGSGGFLVKEIGLSARRLAREFNFAILIINGIVNKLSKGDSFVGSKPALSGLWRYSDVKLYFEILQILPHKTVQAFLLKHNTKDVKDNNSHLSTKFTLSESGIIDIPILVPK